MRVCGVELKGGEAILCLLGYSLNAFEVPESRVRLFAMTDSMPTEEIRKFQSTFKKLLEDYKIEEVVILKREQKGKFAGSATSFKLEAALQLLDMPVTIISASEVKEQMKKTPPFADLTTIGLKKFQKPAFDAAYAYMSSKL